MARMGDWRLDQSEEIELDGIGGVNIIVKADVHRAGKLPHVLDYLFPLAALPMLDPQYHTVALLSY